jgi:hypothetical protein
MGPHSRRELVEPTAKRVNGNRSQSHRGLRMVCRAHLANCAALLLATAGLETSAAPPTCSYSNRQPLQLERVTVYRGCWATKPRPRRSRQTSWSEKDCHPPDISRRRGHPHRPSRRRQECALRQDRLGIRRGQRKPALQSPALFRCHVFQS